MAWLNDRLGDFAHAGEQITNDFTGLLSAGHWQPFDAARFDPQHAGQGVANVPVVGGPASGAADVPYVGGEIGSAEQLVGDFLHVLPWFGSQTIVPATGALAKHAPDAGPYGGLFGLKWNPETQAKLAAVKQAPSNTAAEQVLFQGHPWRQMIWETAGNPLTYAAPLAGAGDALTAASAAGRTGEAANAFVLSEKATGMAAQAARAAATTRGLSAAEAAQKAGLAGKAAQAVQGPSVGAQIASALLHGPEAFNNTTIGLPLRGGMAAGKFALGHVPLVPDMLAQTRVGVGNAVRDAYTRYWEEELTAPKPTEAPPATPPETPPATLPQSPNGKPPISPNGATSPGQQIADQLQQVGAQPGEVGPAGTEAPPRLAGLPEGTTVLPNPQQEPVVLAPASQIGTAPTPQGPLPPSLDPYAGLSEPEREVVVGDLTRNVQVAIRRAAHNQIPDDLRFKSIGEMWNTPAESLKWRTMEPDVRSAFGKPSAQPMLLRVDHSADPALAPYIAQAGRADFGLNAGTAADAQTPIDAYWASQSAAAPETTLPATATPAAPVENAATPPVTPAVAGSVRESAFQFKGGTASPASLDDVPLATRNLVHEALQPVMDSPQAPDNVVYWKGTGDGNAATVAYNVDGTRTLNVNVDDPLWTEHAAGRVAEYPAGKVVDGSPLGMLGHEIGHVLHGSVLDNAQLHELRQTSRLAFLNQARAAGVDIPADVSAYASTSPLEYVAEVYSGLVGGKTFPQPVMDLYHSLSGPSVPNALPARELPPVMGGAQTLGDRVLDTADEWAQRLKQGVSQAWTGQSPEAPLANPTGLHTADAQMWHDALKDTPQIAAVTSAVTTQQQALARVSAAVEAQAPGVLAGVTDPGQYLAVVQQHAPGLYDDARAALRGTAKIPGFGIPGTPGYVDAVSRAYGNAGREAIMKGVVDEAPGVAQIMRSLKPVQDALTHQQSGIGQVYSLGLRALREGTIIYRFPRQLLQDTSDMLTKSMIEHVDLSYLPPAQRVLQRMGGTPTSADQVFGDAGVAVPAGVAFKSPGLAGGIVDQPELQSVDKAGTVTSGTSSLPGKLGDLSLWFRSTRAAIETSFRKAAAATALVNYAGETGVGALGQAATRSLGAVRAASLLDQLTGMDKAVFSAEDVRGAALGWGANARAAQDLATTWARQLNEGSLAGVNLANKIHFNYGDQRNVDQLLNRMTLYHFWSTRNIPYYLNTFADHPNLLRAETAYNQLSQQQQDQLGLTTKVAGKLLRLPAPAIFGPGGGDLFVNPTAIFSFATQAQPRYTDSSEPAVGQLMDQASNLGMVPLPWLQYTLNVLGQYGDQVPDTVLPFTGALQHVAGAVLGTTDQKSNIEGIPQQLAMRARGALGFEPAPPTLSGNPITDQQIAREIRRLAFENTGNPDDTTYTSALGRPGNPIYQAAAKNVAGGSLAHDLVGMFLQLPYSQVSRTEEIARAQGAQLNQQYPNGLSPEVISQMYNDPTNNPVLAVWNTPSDARDAEISSVQALLDAAGPLAAKDPVYLNALAQAYPEWAKYRQWQSERATTARSTGIPLDTSKATYLGNTIDPAVQSQVLALVQAAGWDQTKLTAWLTAHGRKSVQQLRQSDVDRLMQDLSTP